MLDRGFLIAMAAFEAGFLDGSLWAERPTGGAEDVAVVIAPGFSAADVSLSRPVAQDGDYDRPAYNDGFRIAVYAHWARRRSSVANS
jgi:hypothetical protein